MSEKWTEEYVARLRKNAGYGSKDQVVADAHNASLSTLLSAVQSKTDSGLQEAETESVKATRQNALFFVFDVESIGLHGDAFAVAGGVYGTEGNARSEFRMSCPTQECEGLQADRLWVSQNVPEMVVTHRSPKAMRDAFWPVWMAAKAQGALMAADCAWPVEAKFLEQCIKDDEKRNWEGPYPLVDIGSVLLGAGFDPMKDYGREPSELPKHDPLADARQSARLLAMALEANSVHSA